MIEETLKSVGKKMDSPMNSVGQLATNPYLTSHINLELNATIEL